MNSKKHGDAECCKRNIIHGVVLLEDEIEFEYDGGDDDLDGYVLSITDNIRKKESQQELLNTNVDQLENLETYHEKLELVEDLFLDDFFEPCPFYVFLSQLSTINQQ
ncbi:hypothetical protein ACOSQ2_017486 [Xanthoceras sorbifolium]